MMNGTDSGSHEDLGKHGAFLSQLTQMGIPCGCQNWRWLIDLCVEKTVPFLPSRNPVDEPWLSYEAAAVILQLQPETIRKKCKQLRIDEHENFKGFFRMSNLTPVKLEEYGEREKNVERYTGSKRVEDQIC